MLTSDYHLAGFALDPEYHGYSSARFDPAASDDEDNEREAVELALLNVFTKMFKGKDAAINAAKRQLVDYRNK